MAEAPTPRASAIAAALAKDPVAADFIDGLPPIETCFDFVTVRDDGPGIPEGPVARRIVVEDIVVYTVANSERDATVEQIRAGDDRRHHLVRTPGGADQMIIPALYGPGVAARIRRARSTHWRRA